MGLVERFCGFADPDMLDVIERELGRPLAPTYFERVGAIIEHGYRHRLVAIPGIAQALDSLWLPICVASSSALEQIRRKLELTGLLVRFGKGLFSASMVARGKPASDLFLYAARPIGAESPRCLVIEDSPAGIDAAFAARMAALGFCDGSHCGPGHSAASGARCGAGHR
jgi:HAD superfamily hydrolase (TIGR01509 family)